MPPDMVTISLGVAEADKTTSAVLEKVTNTAAEILAKLDALGIAPEDRQTSGFYLHPVHNNRASSSSAAPEITGYRAGNMITVRIRDLEASGPLLDDVIAIGVNNFNGLSFGLQDTAAALAEARALAVADAQLRATQLSQAAGVSLGAVLRISENSHHGGPQVTSMLESRAAMGDAIAGGELEVSARVTMVFEIGMTGE
jgi:uncharacterized protein YggE